MFIVAVPDRLVRDYATRRPVDATPLRIDPTDPYWAVMLRDQDVVEVPDPGAADPDAPDPTPAPKSKKDA